MFERRYPLLCWLTLLVMIGGIQRGWADAIVVSKAMAATTIAEIFVEDSLIRVELEIGEQDLPAFRNLLPDEAYRTLTEETKSQAQRQAEFFRQDFQIRADNAQPLPGKIHRVENRQRQGRDEITGRPIAAGDGQRESVWFAELHFPLTARPRTLTFRPPRHDQSQLSAASIGFVLYHQGLPTTDFRYLSTMETLDLDWDDPWYSRFRNRNLRRQFDAPLTAFLYVEHFEVRKEIVVRPRDLQHWIDLGLGDRKKILVAEQEPMKKSVADFLAERNEVTIDGKPVQPKLDRIHFIRRTLRQTGVVEPAEDLDTVSATLGVIFVYPISGLPQKVTMKWDMFSDRIQQLPAVATDQAGGLPTTLTVQDPLLQWRNFLTNPKLPAMLAIEPPPQRPLVAVPWISLLLALVAVGLAWSAWRSSAAHDQRWYRLLGCLVCGGCAIFAARFRWDMPRPLAKPAALSSVEADAVLGGLLHNLYRAFDRREESLVYDRLAQSVAGDLLKDAYLSTRRSMELANQGGARVKVLDVKLESSEVQPLSDRVGFRSDCQWTVAGAVGHWGHTHRRMNRYAAVLTVEPIDGVWKIKLLDLQNQERLDRAKPQRP